MTAFTRLLWAFLIIVVLLLSLPTIFQNVLPLSFSELIVYYGNIMGVEPSLVAAVIRVESSFRPTVVSEKGAVGLMQLMPDTARWLAEQRNQPFSLQSLNEPETNIELGVYYLKYLLERFPTEQAALAAYNGGPANVRRWLEEGIWDGTLAGLHQIPFSETRTYVKKVGVWRQIYQLFYEEDLGLERS